jgi:hypothetical protein
MSRPLRPGLVAEGDSDCRFLMPVIDRQLGTVLHSHPHADFDLVPIRRSTYVKKHGSERFRRAASELAATCHVLFVHADYREKREAERMAGEIGTTACRPVIIVPKQETEAWLLADAAMLKRIRGADLSVVPSAPKAVEDIPDPKKTLASAVAPAGVADPADFFDLLGRNVDLGILRRIPAYRDWLGRTVECLKGLNYL